MSIIIHWVRTLYCLGCVLILTSGVVTAAPADSVSADSLTAGPWTLTELHSLSVDEPFAIGRPYLHVDPDTTSVSGWGGCNRFSADLSSDQEKRIQFGRISSTQMECPDMDLENNLFRALERTVRFDQNEDGFLDFYDASAIRVARFSSGTP